MIETVNEDFFRRRGIMPANLYKAARGAAYFSFDDSYDPRMGFEKKINKNDNYSDLEKLMFIVDSARDNDFCDKIESVLNIDNTLRYMAISFLLDNCDGIFHNFYLFNNPDTNLFEFIPWDLDITFCYADINIELNNIDNEKESKLFSRILANEHYRRRYADIMLSLLENEFSPENIAIAVERKIDIIHADYANDPYINICSYDLSAQGDVITDYVAWKHEQARLQLDDFIR